MHASFAAAIFALFAAHVFAAPINTTWASDQLRGYNLSAALGALENAPLTLSDALPFLRWATLDDAVEMAVSPSLSAQCKKVVAKKNEWIKVAVSCGALDVWDAFMTPLNATQLSNLSYVTHKYADPICSVQDDCRRSLQSFWKRSYAACGNETVLDNHGTPAVVIGLLNRTVPGLTIPSTLPDWANISSPAYLLNLTVTDVFDLLNLSLTVACTQNNATGDYCLAEVGAKLEPAVAAVLAKVFAGNAFSLTDPSILGLLTTVTDPSFLCSDCVGQLVRTVAVDHANDKLVKALKQGVDVAVGLRAQCTIVLPSNTTTVNATTVRR